MGLASRTFTLPEPKVLFEEHYQAVRQFFVRRGFPSEEARDLTQETFLQIFRTQQQYRGEASPRTWVLGVARNIYRGHLKRHHSQKRKGNLVPLESTVDHEVRGEELPLDRFIAKEQETLFRQAIEELSSSQRDCLLLRIDQELSYREIANLCGISIEAVKGRIFQAKKSLRLALNEHFEDDLP